MTRETKEQEHWIPWKPDNVPGFRCWAEEFHDTKAGIVIILEAEKGGKFELHFEPGSVHGYRNVNESFLLDQQIQIDEQGWSFNFIENSLFLEFLHEQSLGIYKDSAIFCLCIATGEDVIELLTDTMPTVRLLTP